MKNKIENLLRTRIIMFSRNAGTERRSGSALLVVLGILAVLMMMSVFFSVFMRTERAGTTNLRHSIVAKQSMQTALASVMASIDRSFENPTNDWPIPAWPEGFLASSETAPYYQSRILLDEGQSSANNQTFWNKRSGNAHVLTEEIRKHLSPSQIALVNNAVIGWAPIKGGVVASAAEGQAGGDRSFVRPEDDQVVGRYAFVALNTTGLLDMNHYEPSEEVPLSIDPIGGSDFVRRYISNRNFYDKRQKAGDKFTSYADMINNVADRGLPYVYSDGDGGRNIVSRDLFNTFSTSLTECAPDGSMKIPIVDPDDTSIVRDKKAYIKAVYQAFKKVFKTARNGNSDEFLFKSAASGAKIPELSRAHLATQAFFDYIDSDDVPAGADVAMALGSDAPANASRNPLDYPCTEPVPKLNGVYAQFSIDKSTVNDEKGPLYDEYAVFLTIGAVAAPLNGDEVVPEGLENNTYTMEMHVMLYDVLDRILDLYDQSFSPEGWDLIFPSNFDSLHDFTKVSPPHPITEREWAWGDGFTLMTIRAYYKEDSEGNRMGPRKISHMAEHSPQDLRTEIKVGVKIRNQQNTVVQQVPAPMLTDGVRPAEKYYVSVWPSMCHAAGSRPNGELDWAEGWALVSDPRFAYNTGSIVHFPPNGYITWINNEQAYWQARGGGGALTDLCKLLLQHEENGDMINYSQGNPLINEYWLPENKDNAKLYTEALSQAGGPTAIYPDTTLSYERGGPLFNVNDTIPQSLYTHIANRPMKSVGELGKLMIGPWETFSLFKTFRPNDEAVHHRVIDYFCTEEPRYPRVSEMSASAGKEHFPAVHTGKVNLNAPQIVRCIDEMFELGIISREEPYLNYDPLGAVLSGIPLKAFPSAKIKNAPELALSVNSATNIAAAFYRDSYFDEKKNEAYIGEEVYIPMIKRLSDLGNSTKTDKQGGEDWNPILKTLIERTDEGKRLYCDAHREAVIANSVEHLTTRGQSFLVVMRADAFSPDFGSDSSSMGTTLSETHAVVELWRDPEPVRDSSGKLYPNEKTPSHNWYIRSVRWF